MVKISDVARHAGVSPSTVSYVLSGKRSISEQTRRRVLDSVRTLGYRPHAGARALASSRSNVIALVVPLRSGIHVPVVMQMAIAAVTTARTHDHDVLLLTQDEGVDGLERVAGTALVDAIIVMDVELHDVRLPVLRSLGFTVGAHRVPGRRDRADLHRPGLRGGRRGVRGAPGRPRPPGDRAGRRAARRVRARHRLRRAHQDGLPARRRRARRPRGRPALRPSGRPVDGDRAPPRPPGPDRGGRPQRSRPRNRC